MKTRNQALAHATTEQFDVVVIGGGIAGAGVAQDAASRGLSVCLIEKDDFASGTSSRTTKLIHGGLRYLEQFHFKLTRELCAEREILEQLAPHMVHSFPLIMPLVPGDWFFNLKASLGLTLYDLLSFSIAHGVHQRLSRQRVIDEAPALSPKAIAGGLRFHDCQTDDARMVLEVIKSAAHFGALAINYLQVTGFQQENGKVQKVVCQDRISGKQLEIAGKCFINACGVWSDELYKKLSDGWKEHVKPAKGIHIIVPQSALEINTALFLPTKDDRYVFVIPWQRALMVGTTDSPYEGNLDNPLPTSEEIDYLISIVNGYTGKQKLNRSQIIGSFAGLRPLVLPSNLTAAKNTSSLSREHIIFDGPGDTIGVTGGKLTNFRIMAKQVVDRIDSKYPDMNIKPSTTRNIMIGGWHDKEDFLTQQAAISARARRLSLDPATIEHILATYGADANKILDIVENNPDTNERICPDFPPIMAEVPFCTREEMSESLEDLLMRRLRLGILNQRQCLDAAPRVAKIMQSVLGWDNRRLDMEIQTLDRLLNEHLAVLAK